MMIDLSELAKHTGRRVQLRFVDGYVANVTLIDVDADSRGTELIYEVDTVVAWGSFDATKVDPKAVPAADAADVVAWSSLE